MALDGGASPTSLRRGSGSATSLLLETVSRSPEETIRLGRDFIQRLDPPCLILLEGELGSGKTTFTKGLVAGLGAAREEEVSSPSFTLVHEYGPPPAARSAMAEVSSGLRTAGRACRVFHVDLYRVESPREMETLGLEDLLAQPAFVIVEWGEKLAPPRIPRVRVRFEHAGAEARKITAEMLAK
jgi:tRNA threonylcarbamoyladenosine biosynthesis protein TsaE